MNFDYVFSRHLSKQNCTEKKKWDIENKQNIKNTDDVTLATSYQINANIQPVIHGKNKNIVRKKYLWRFHGCSHFKNDI